MVESSKKLGRMGRAIVESFVEDNLDEKFAVERAMQATADRLWKKWVDKRLWNAIFNPLPKTKKLLIDLKQSVKIFYDNPADNGFAEVLTEILHEHEGLFPKAIQKAVKEYITTLTEELLLADKDFLEKARGLSDPRVKRILNRVVKLQASQELPIQQKTHDSSNLIRKAEDDLQAALAKLKRMPGEKIPELTSIPKDSRFPNLLSKTQFIGREAELKQLAAWLKKGDKPVVIGQLDSATGMGGIGKTQLASEFALRYGRYFSAGVFWLNFSDPVLIPIQVAACGVRGYEGSLDARVKQVLSEWQSEMPRLLIFDNCNDPSLLAQWRPRVGGSRVLVTSRQGSWDPSEEVEQLSLGLLERQESIALLRGFRDDLESNDPDLNAIASALKDLPLALHIAGSFLRSYRSEVNPGEYLNALLQPRRLKRGFFIDNGFNPGGHDLGVGHSIVICIDRLDEEGETARAVMSLLQRFSCLAPGEMIPKEILKTILGEEVTDSKTFVDRMDRLVGMGLVEENESGRILMHKLVASFIQEILPDKGWRTLVEQAVISAALNANQSGEPGRMQPVLAQLKHITDQALIRKDEPAARLANEMAFYLNAITDYMDARPYYEKALAINQKVLGEEHPDTARSLNNLGHLLQAMGNYAGARPYYEKSLAIRRKLLGEMHPDTARSLNNLGYLLQTMGDYTGARTYFEQALAIRKKVLREEHPDTAISHKNLGYMQQLMGDHVAARQNFEQALAIRKKALGEEHPDTATSLNDLGGVLQTSGDYENAQQNFEQALAINRKVLGEEQLNTATSLSNLGGLLQAMGDNQNARAYFEQALAINRKILGDEHPRTATSLSNLGRVLQGLGKYPAAQKNFEQALAIRKKVLGEEHLDTAASLNDLGGLLQTMGDIVGAQPYQEQAEAIRIRLQAKEQPNNVPKVTLRTKVIVAALFILSLAVISWQILDPGPISAALVAPIANPGETGILPTLAILPKPTSTPSKTATSLPTKTIAITPTPTITFTSTKHLTILFDIPTSTSQPVEINWTDTPNRTKTLVPTNILFPTFTLHPTDIPIPPTNIPIPSDTPVPPTDIPVPPTDIPTPRNTPVPTDIPTPRNTPLPTDVPTPRNTPLPIDTPGP